MSNIFDPDNKEINIQQINPIQLQEKINENLGQYIDIKYNFSLSKNSFKREATQKIEAEQKIINLKTSILAYLSSNASVKSNKHTFSEADIENYFNEFKSPYHTSAQTDKYKDVLFTSEHMSRLIAESYWLQKNKDKNYDGKKYKTKGDDTFYYEDDKHFGIDLSYPELFSRLYPTQAGKIKFFPNETGLGNVIAIQHSISKSGKVYFLPLVSVYAHLHASLLLNPFLSDSQSMDINIGLEGNTPTSSNFEEHLHLELWKVDNSFDLNASTPLSSIRKTTNPDISYNYRYINSTFQSFKDATRSSLFYEVDDKGNKKNATDPVLDPLQIKLRTISKNIFLNGNNDQKGIISFAYNLIDENSEENKDKAQKYYDIFKRINDQKKMIIDNYANENINKKDNDIYTFSFEKNSTLEDDQKPINIDIDFTALLEKKDETVAEKTDVTFGKNIKEDFASGTPLFVFYFPLRFNLFRNNYQFKIKINDPTSQLLEAHVKSNENYFIRFKIFKVGFNDILQMKYEKSQQNFSISKKIDVKKEIENESYSFDIIRKKADGTIEEISENINIPVRLFDHDKSIQIFRSRYKKQDKKVKIEIIAEKDDILKLSFKALPSTDDDEIGPPTNNDSLNNFIQTYFSQRHSSENEAEFLKNSFNSSFRFFFKEKFFENKSSEFHNDSIQLPDLILSTVYDTTFFDNVNNFLNTYKNFQKTDKRFKAYDIDLSNEKYFVPNDIDNPLHHFVDFPFVESQFFSHRLISQYLPEKSLYNKKFTKLNKKVPYTQNKTGSNFYDYEFEQNKKIQRQQLSGGSRGEKDLLFRPKNQNAPLQPFYFLDIDLDELYNEIIYNMINIEIFNITD